MRPPILRRLFTTPLGLGLCVLAMLSLVSMATLHTPTRDMVSSALPDKWLGTGSGTTVANAAAKNQGA